MTSRKIPSFKSSRKIIIATMVALGSMMAMASRATALTFTPVPTEVVTSFEPGHILESIAFDQSGSLYLSLPIQGEVRKILPNGEQTTLATLPHGQDGFFGGLLGILGALALDQQGNVYIAQNSTDVTVKGIWRIAADGTKERLVALPKDSLPNGITLDGDDNIFVADSTLGIVWRIPRGTHEAEVWIQDVLVSPTSGTGFPGANGIKFYQGDLYVANSDTGNILRIPVQPDGTAGTPLVYATGVPTDDFAFDVLGNLYATTHPFNTVVRIGRDGQQEVLATVDQGIIGPSSAAFGTREGDRTNLYVVTDGGLFGSVINPNSPTGRPSVVKLDIGILTKINSKICT
jgi:sugar lactone lactonase YvrE